MPGQAGAEHGADTARLLFLAGSAFARGIWGVGGVRRPRGCRGLEHPQWT